MILIRSIAKMMRDTGDYQFDIYRIMKEYVGPNWASFNPFTNVMVLSDLFYQYHLLMPSLLSGCTTLPSNSSSQKI